MIGPGDVILDRYRVVALLGEGGMGSVFEAVHIAVGRKVALKVLHSEFAKKKAIVDRFEREARSAAAIGHDNIIDVIDFGQFEGAPFLVMEHLKGESLGARLERVGVLPIDHASYIMGQVLSALGAAHAAGIVHRDLKPDNVFMITKAGFADFVKLLDFGIAKLKADDQAPGKGLTQTGVAIGTPWYMSPEQALAKRDIDHRADLYSAGVMLYEMVTGKLPFDAESHTELLMEIVNRRNAVVDPTAHNPAIPPEFAAIVMKSFAHDRDARFVDAAEFIAAIAPYMGSAPLAAAIEQTGRHKILAVPPAETVAAIAPQTPPRRDAGAALATMIEHDAPKPATRSRVNLLVGAAIVIVVLATATVYAVRGSQHARPPQETTHASVAASSVPTAGQTVQIDLEQVPPDAVVTIDDQPSTSHQLTFARGTSHRLRVSAAGKQDFEDTLVADRDRALVIPALAATPPQAIAPADAAAAVAAEVVPSPTHPRGSNHHSSAQARSPAAATTPGNPQLPVSHEF